MSGDKVRWRADVPQELIERAEAKIPSAKSMSDAEKVRYIIRQFVRDRQLEELEAKGEQ
jgi:hypothetical protein